MVYKFRVKSNGVYYPSGAEVPEWVAPMNEVIEETEEVAEIPKEVVKDTKDAVKEQPAKAQPKVTPKRK